MRKTVAIQLLPYPQVGTLPARTVYVVPTTYIIDIFKSLSCLGEIKQTGYTWIHRIPLF